MASANVNSLHAGPDGYSGKLQFIRDQMRGLHLNFLGIQESRTVETCTCTDEVLRLGGGADKGHHGIELWVNLRQPIAYVRNKPVFLNKQQIVVVHKTPRVLLVRIAHDIWSAWILVAHAPQSGQTDRQRTVWWDSLNEMLHQHIAPGELFALIDANAAAGPTDGISVGPLGMDTTKSTALFRSFLAEWGLALPCTFSCHQGHRDTWCSPDGTIQACIDYVCVPQHQLPSCKLSRTVPELDLGNRDVDHSVVAIQMEWTGHHMMSKGKAPRKAHNRSSIDRHSLAVELAQFTVPEWSTAAHTQVERHNAHVHSCLHAVNPPLPKKAKKSFITDAIWILRDDKLHQKRKVQDIGRRIRAETLRAVFVAWRTRDQQWHTEHSVIFHRYQVALTCWKLFHGVQLHVTAKDLKKRLKDARKKALAVDLTSLSPEAEASEALKIVKQHIGPTNPKLLKKPVLPMLQSLEGDLCVHPEQLIDTWVSFFAHMEGGQRVTSQELYDKWKHHSASFLQTEICIGPDDVPSLTDLEQAFRRVKSGKALGQDGIPPEICKACPVVLARQYYSVLLKMLIHGQESLHHKGGTLVPAYKGKGSSMLPASYRSLLISSHLGKVLHRTIRQHQAQIYEQYLCAQQLGGKRKVPVNLGLHEARAFLRSNQLRGRSVALLMLDLKEAFYRVLRPLALGCEWTDQQVASIAHRLCLPESALHDLYRHLSEPSAIACADLPPHVQRSIRALHTDTFFQVPGQKDFCHTSIGSRPGDCFADVVFSYLFSRVLKEFQTKVRAQGIHESIETASHFDPYGLAEHTGEMQQYLGPVWMDDLCIGLTDNTPDQLIHKAGTTASILLETLEGFAMTPNLSRGKTEILLSLRGPGVRKCKKQMLGPHTNGMLPVICESGTKYIAVVGQYQHLGGLLHNGGDHRIEMRRRIAIANTAFNQHRRTIFHNDAISFKKRVELFQTLILSKLVYGSESWILATHRAKGYLHASIMRLYRRLCRSGPESHDTDQDILSRVGLPTPTELFRQMRLRYLGTLHACDSNVTWSILNADQEWCALPRDDLHWMWSQLQHSSSLLDPSSNLHQWRYLWCYHKRYWKGLIKRAIAHAHLQRCNQALVCEVHEKILCKFTDAQLIQRPPPMRVTPPEPAKDFFGCIACQLQLKSKGGEGAHMFKCHGMISPLRYLFAETRCEACMKEYHTFGQLHHHLRSSASCRLRLQRQNLQCAPVAGWGSMDNACLVQQRNGLLPPLVCEGPKLPTPQEREVADFDTEVFADCAEVLMERCTLAESVSAMIQRMKGRVISWTRFTQMVQTFENQVQEDDLKAFGLTHSQCLQFCQEIIDTKHWPFMHRLSAELPSAEVTSADLGWQCANSEILDEVGPIAHPQSFGTHRYILHAFSGRRRQGDFQFFLDSLIGDRPGIVVHTLSVDIILDERWGNVADPEVQSFWCHAVRQKWVLGFLGGPPCETWSRAREHALDDPKGRNTGPRVVRTGHCPWGLSSLSLREIRQVFMGNQLMLFSITIMVELYFTGGCGAMEHPAAPKKEESATIWRTPLLELLLSFEAFQLVEFMQGLLGAITAKPTMILALRLPCLAQQICRWRIVDEVPKGASLGRGSDGNFKTMILKEYPPALCGALASAFMHELDAFPIDIEVQVPPSFRAACVNMQVQTYGTELGPDFMGGKV